MPKIQQLDAHVADLIAAGEVVERPASAVKELVENSIDAGASSITVEIRDGGMTFIRITDDGCGMEPADARIAFLRHATSKLRTKDDLAAIGTLGFRGEALAAISSVSKIDLLTKTRESAAGTALYLEAGVIRSEEPAGCADGTTILVRDLFYNTPARMKFMKSDMAEASAVFAAVQREALAHPEISFRFLKDGAEQLHTSGDGDRRAAIYQILGRQLVNDMVPVESRWEKISVSGFVTKPTATRGNRSFQYFFVNGRFIKSRTLSAAVEEAYKNQIMAGRFPACVLEIELPVQAVDVNVHPAKTEVRFLSERSVFDAVHYGVLSALNKTPGAPEMRLPEKKAAQAAVQPPQNDFFKTMTAEAYRASAAAPKAPSFASDVQLPKRPSAPAEPSDVPERSAVPEKPAPAFSAAPAARAARPVSVFPDDLEAALFGGSESRIETKPAALEPASEEPEEAALPPFAPAEPEKPRVPIEAELTETAPAASEKAEPSQPDTPPEQDAIPLREEPWHIIGEALDTYIIVEEKDAVLFIDKHAAHERILFEKLKKQNAPVMSQLLLAPIPAPLSREEAAAVLENAALLEQYGFGVEDFGDGTVLLRRVPADIAPEDAGAGLAELAGHLLEGRTLAPESLRDELLHTVACKAAIKAGYHTQPREREALVREVLTRDDLKYCPHGRPICITLTQKQLEKQFKRI